MYIVGVCVFVTYIILQIWEVYFRRQNEKDNSHGYYSRHNKPEKRDQTNIQYEIINTIIDYSNCIGLQ